MPVTFKRAAIKDRSSHFSVDGASSTFLDYAYFNVGKIPLPS